MRTPFPFHAFVLVAVLALGMLLPAARTVDVYYPPVTPPIGNTGNAFRPWITPTADGGYTAECPPYSAITDGPDGSPVCVAD